MERSTRSVGDSWDLASSVGATATMVAAARAVASREPDLLIDDPYAAPLVRAVGAEGLLVYLPPDAQDRLSDSITALSAPGSRLATEYHPDAGASIDELAPLRDSLAFIAVKPDGEEGSR